MSVGWFGWMLNPVAMKPIALVFIWGLTIQDTHSKAQYGDDMFNDQATAYHESYGTHEQVSSIIQPRTVLPKTVILKYSTVFQNALLNHF